MEALILAAGQGTRMKSSLPKVLHPLFERPMIDYVMATLTDCRIRKPKVVIGNGAARVRSFLGNKATYVVQKVRKGTGHAVMMAAPVLKKSKGDILIWPGDMPLVKSKTLQKFIKAHQDADNDVSVLSSVLRDPSGYGRILRNGRNFEAIREELDASPDQRKVCEVNTGVYLFKSKSLFSALSKIKADNEKKEYYLTDTIEILVDEGSDVEAYAFASEDEGLGINSQKDLAKATAVINEREISRHQANGVTFMAPEQTFIAPGVEIGRGTVIYPWTYIETSVRIGKDCSVGPFAKLRMNSVLGDGVNIGSFVEVNRSKIAGKVNARHLAYLGDAEIGEGTNIGAGTITANFDGKHKYKTKIGKNVLVGSDTVFVAPVSVGDKAKTGAGSVITGGTRIKSNETVAGVPAKPMRSSKKSNRRKKTR